MSLVGFDIGNERCVVAVARKSGIDVFNAEAICETPAIVSFGETQRFLGTACMTNPNTISQIKRLIGRSFSDPELQQDLKALPFSVTAGPDGYPLIHAHNLGETKSFTPTQVMAMVFSNVKTIAEKDLNAPVVDCCIGIPIYFTALQRRAVMDAATIAGLHPLRLVHETTAAALAYGMHKTDLPEDEEHIVAFVDIGHASMQVCIAGFKKGQLKILAHTYDRYLGGRDFDEVLFQHFAEKFKAEYKIDVFENARACIRLRAACENLKKVLTANPEAPLNIECLMDGKDVTGFIKRDDFEKISKPILSRVKKPLAKALSEAHLNVADIDAVEVLGSGSRVPAVDKILKKFFKKEPRRRRNADVCVSEGCALECARLSPTFKVKEFEVQECFPFTVSMTWTGFDRDSDNNTVEKRRTTLVFPKGSSIPCEQPLSFDIAHKVIVDVLYLDESGSQTLISTYTFGPYQYSRDELSVIQVDALLNVHGIPCVDHFQWIRKSNKLSSELFYGAMLPADVQKDTEKLEMALQDRIMKETKNAVEAYVHEMRNKLHNELQEFVTDAAREEFLAKLQETEDWLCEDETQVAAYFAKLEELKRQGDPIEQRYKEHSESELLIDQMATLVDWYIQASYEYGDHSERIKVCRECYKAKNWIREKKLVLRLSSKHENPVLSSSDIREKTEALGRVCWAIMQNQSRPHCKQPLPMPPGEPSHGVEN